MYKKTGNIGVMWRRNEQGFDGKAVAGQEDTLTRCSQRAWSQILPRSFLPKLCRIAPIDSACAGYCTAKVVHPYRVGERSRQSTSCT